MANTNFLPFSFIYLKLSSHSPKPLVSRRGSLKNFPMESENFFNWSLLLVFSEKKYMLGLFLINCLTNSVLPTRLFPHKTINWGLFSSHFSSRNDNFF